MILGMLLGAAAAACTLGQGAIEKKNTEKKMKEEVSKEVANQTSDIRNSVSMIDARVSVLEQEVGNNTRNIEELKNQFHIT